MTHKSKLVVIGNGMAGARFVEEVLARRGNERFEIVVFGAEPYGNYNRILLSGVLSGQHHPRDILINPLSWYVENDIKLHAGVRVVEIDRAAKLVHGEGGVTESYDQLVIATGSRPFMPPLAGISSNATAGWKEGLFVFRTLDDCDSIMKYAAVVRKVAVIGGGLLGLEAAYGLFKMGLEVHVVHLMSHLMETQLDADAGEVLKGVLKKMGIHIHLEKVTTAVRGDEQVTGLTFEDGSTLECDMVVISAGIRPNAELARQAGLTVERGIVVGDDLACQGDPDVYSLGECAQHRGQLYGLVAPLWEQASILADRLTGCNPQAIYEGSHVSTKLKVMGIELAVMGEKEASQPEDEVVIYSDEAHGIYKKLVVREGRLIGAILMGEGTMTPKVFQAFDRASELPHNRAELLFPLTWEAPPAILATSLPDTARICDCNGVSKGAIVAAIKRGCGTLKQVSDATRAGTGCGSCQNHIQALLEAEAPSTADVLSLSTREKVSVTRDE